MLYFKIGYQIGFSHYSYLKTIFIIFIVIIIYYNFIHIIYYNFSHCNFGYPIDLYFIFTFHEFIECSSSLYVSILNINLHPN